MLVILNQPRTSRLSDFEITRVISPTCTPLGPITITYYYLLLLLLLLVTLTIVHYLHFCCGAPMNKKIFYIL